MVGLHRIIHIEVDHPTAWNALAQQLLAVDVGVQHGLARGVGVDHVLRLVGAQHEVLVPDCLPLEEHLRAYVRLKVCG